MEGDALTVLFGLPAALAEEIRAAAGAVAAIEGDALVIFYGALASVALSLWLLAFRPRIRVPPALPGPLRLLLELADDWLRLFGGWFACGLLPVAAMLALAVPAGGLQFWHWPAAIVIFAVVAVWRLR